MNHRIKKKKDRRKGFKTYLSCKIYLKLKPPSASESNKYLESMFCEDTTDNEGLKKGTAE